MRQETHFIIFKTEDQYSITEISGSDVKRGFMTNGCVSGDRDVLLKLSRTLPVNESLREFVENNSGRLICIYEDSKSLTHSVAEDSEIRERPRMSRRWDFEFAMPETRQLA